MRPGGGARVCDPKQDEVRRKVMHMLFGLPALLFPWLSFRIGAVMAIFACFVNAVILKRSTATAALFRDGENWRGGIVLYPAVIAALFLIHRDNTFAAAGGWLVLAFGDGAATLAGSRRPIRPLPWNPRKSWGGIVAGFAGSCVALILVYWTHDVSWQRFGWTIGLFGAFAAFIESLDTPINDNVLMPLGTSLMLRMVS